MGGEAFKELLRRRGQYDIVLLLLPSKAERRAFSHYEGQPGIAIVWGDLCNPTDVQEAVSGVDYVLHPAALIPPAADHNPPLSERVNYSGTVNLIEAIKSEPDGANHIRLVYISSIAIYGDRLPPVHMARVGDPLKPSVGDFYATTKMAAERAVIESGLRYWASLRQTYIGTPNALALMDPILFHQPVNTPIELITREDAGYGLVQTLEAPDEFWGRVYNMSGGPSCRVVFAEYLARMMRIFGLGDITKITHLNWFAKRNFHCCWYEDSYILNQYLDHWRHSLEDHYRDVEEAAPWYLKLGGRITLPFLVKGYMKRLADPLRWIQDNDEEKIKAFFGSRQMWESIPDWGNYVSDPPPYAERSRELAPETYTIEHMQELAASRGGQCLSEEFIDLKTRLRWRCGFGHEWEATPLLHQAGHWCPQCAPPPWKWDDLAKVDPLLAEYYYTNHSRDECQRVDWLHCPNE